jgi:hypothetical protein
MSNSAQRRKPPHVEWTAKQPARVGIRAPSFFKAHIPIGFARAA